MVSVELALTYGLACRDSGTSETTAHRKRQIELMHSSAETAMTEKLHHPQKILIMFTLMSIGSKGVYVWVPLSPTAFLITMLTIGVVVPSMYSLCLFIIVVLAWRNCPQMSVVLAYA